MFFILRVRHMAVYCHVSGSLGCLLKHIHQIYTSCIFCMSHEVALRGTFATSYRLLCKITLKKCSFFSKNLEHYFILYIFALKFKPLFNITYFTLLFSYNCLIFHISLCRETRRVFTDFNFKLYI